LREAYRAFILSEFYDCFLIGFSEVEYVRWTPSALEEKMGRFMQDNDSHGSLKDLQILINEKPELLNKKLTEKIGKPINITWKSPLSDDQFAEYRDQEFIDLLGLKTKITYPLNDFWPNRGPQWDALGLDKDIVFIVEAKANIPEIVSPGTGAGSESKAKIMDAFSEVKEYLNINNNIDWSGTFYQYANRIAHLYYLRVLNGINAFLINIYFINDDSVEGPASEQEWHGAIRVIKQYLGIPKRNKLDKYMVNVFIDVKKEGIVT